MLNKTDEGKIYYSISEVCNETGLEQHVLRYWETEFPQLKPKKNRAGNRAYRQKDIKLIKLIKHLLYQEHYTIVGAKRKLAKTKDYDIDVQIKLPLVEEEKPAKPAGVASIRRELETVLRILEGK